MHEARGTNFKNEAEKLTYNHARSIACTTIGNTTKMTNRNKLHYTYTCVIFIIFFIDDSYRTNARRVSVKHVSIFDFRHQKSHNERTVVTSDNATIHNTKKEALKSVQLIGD